jgi:single-stranded-DNA-specific exonuclease
MDKKWLIPPGLNAEEERAIQDLSTQIKAPELVAELIYRRGLRNQSDIQEFFHPDLSHLTDPFLFEDMEAAVTRIYRQWKTLN